jgi:hypothetical protein
MARSHPDKPAIIILTAFPLLPQEWKASGAHALLEKPTPPQHMWEIIDEVMAARRIARSSAA